MEIVHQNNRAQSLVPVKSIFEIKMMVFHLEIGAFNDVDALNYLSCDGVCTVSTTSVVIKCVATMKTDCIA